MYWPPQRREGVPLGDINWGRRIAAYTCSVCGQAGEVQVNAYCPSPLKAHPGCSSLAGYIRSARQARSPEEAARCRRLIAALWADSTDSGVTAFQRGLARRYLAESTPEPGR